MGVATILLCAVLTVQVDLRMSTATDSRSSRPELQVDLRRRAPGRTPPPANQPPIVELEPVDVAITQRTGSLISIEEPAIEPESDPAPDWRALTSDYAREFVADQFRREEIRAAMWQRSHSAMFQRDEHFAMLVETPILEDLDFREPAGVLGLGITIGSCFIGIPLAGIPVEERSVAITVFYCKG